MYACSNLIRIFNKGYETITAEALMLLITVYPVYVMINGKNQKAKIDDFAKSQNDSSLQNSTNVKYAPNYKNMQYS